MGRGFSLLAAVARVLVLTAALAGVAYLDKAPRAPAFSQAYTFNTRQPVPSAVAARPAPAAPKVV